MDEHKISVPGGPPYFITLNLPDSYRGRHWWRLAVLVGLLTLVVSAMVGI